MFDEELCEKSFDRNLIIDVSDEVALFAMEAIELVRDWNEIIFSGVEF